MTKLTVVQMLPALESGGVERGTLEVSKHLVEQGHRSIVISAGGRLVTQLEREGGEHLAWNVGRKSLLTPIRYIGRLRRFLRDEQADILHVRSRMPGWVGYLAWNGMDPETRPHFVTTVHGPYSVNAYSGVMTKGERVIVISKMIREYVLENYPGVEPDKLRLIYRGVDPEEFPHGYRPPEEWLARWHQDYPQTRGKQLITLPARITRWKGQEDFIELMARLKTGHADVHGLIVGGTHPRRRQFLEELQAKVKVLGLEQDITFTGLRSDLREVMAISSVVLSFSRAPEAFGRTSIEALSLGVPVIAYDHGGVGEQLATTLPEGGIGVGDLDAAAKLMMDWLVKPPPVPATQPFTLEQMLNKTLNVYFEVIQT